MISRSTASSSIDIPLTFAYSMLTEELDFGEGQVLEWVGKVPQGEKNSFGISLDRRVIFSCWVVDRRLKAMLGSPGINVFMVRLCTFRNSRVAMMASAVSYLLGLCCRYVSLLRRVDWVVAGGGEARTGPPSIVGDIYPVGAQTVSMLICVEDGSVFVSLEGRTVAGVEVLSDVGEGGNFRFPPTWGMVSRLERCWRVLLIASSWVWTDSLNSGNAELRSSARSVWSWHWQDTILLEADSIELTFSVRALYRSDCACWSDFILATAPSREYDDGRGTGGREGVGVADS